MSEPKITAAPTSLQSTETDIEPVVASVMATDIEPRSEKSLKRTPCQTDSKNRYFPI